MPNQLALVSQSSWRPGPEAPYYLIPAHRRFEWLVFAATPIGGCLAISDPATTTKILTAVLFAAVCLAVPWGVRELYYRLSIPAANALSAILGLVASAFVSTVLAVLLNATPIGFFGAVAFYVILAGLIWLYDKVFA